MIQKAKFIAVLFALALFARTGLAQTCKTNVRDKTAVVAVLRTLYAGATVDDMAKMHSATAASFYGFDGGIQYNSIDDLMIVVKADQDRGVKYVWSVTQPKVTLHCNDAWITYVNQGSIQMPGSEVKPAQWLESAVLKKQGGVWKIVFFHSTFVRATKLPQ